MPHFYLPPNSGGEVSAGRGECERSNSLPEGEVVEHYAAGYVCENGAAIFVDGEEEVSAGVEGEAGDVFAVGEGEGMGFRTVE
jgi:hypothetical protein